MGARAALREAGRLNPGYLKLDLFCRGLRLAPDCRLDAGQETLRRRAGLGSGLELRIPGSNGMCVNAPVEEPFARESPYVLHGPDARGAYGLTHDGEALGAIEVPPRPAFYDRLTSSSKPMGSVGVIQGTYLGVYHGALCANWKQPGADACRFCGVGTSVMEGGERTDKTPQDIVETALAAREELGITFVHVNGGFDDGGRYLERFGPVVQALHDRTGLLVGLQLPPLPDLGQYAAFRRLGVNNVSLCFELWDPERFETVCPGKSRRAGLERFREAIRHCVDAGGFETVNGELIAGLEDPADSMAAIDWLTQTGAVPTVCVFRPVAGTAYADRAPPATDAMVEVFGHAYRRCMERGLPIGIAPNIHVSIVMNPEECRWLLPPARRGAWRLRRLKLAALRQALKVHVRRRVRRALERTARRTEAAC